MAKNCFFLVLALFSICVSSLAIPPVYLDPTPASLTRAHSGHASSRSSRASSIHKGSKTTSLNKQAPISRGTSVVTGAAAPSPTSVLKAIASRPKTPHHANIPPIIIILSILFGIPLIGFLVVTFLLSCRRDTLPKKEITLNTWDIYRKNRHQAMEAAAEAAKRSRSVSPSSGKSRRSKLSGIGLGLNVDLGPSSVIRHTPRRPSPLRQVYTAADPMPVIETPVLSEFGSTNSLPRSALHYYQGSRSPMSPSSSASMSPRTPDIEVIPLQPQMKHLDEEGNAVYRPSVIAKDDAGSRTELDISDAYDSYFVLGDEDEDALIGTARW